MTTTKKKTSVEDATFQDLRGDIEQVRERINGLRQGLSRFFVGKAELVDLMCVASAAQEPFLIVGPPGTAKSDLVTKFCQALGLGDADYFEYMLTKFTEPSELMGPVDLQQLKDGKYVRKTSGKLPQAKVAFLDEIFKSNSAILNTLLTVINERKVYQDGKAEPIPLKLLFAATNSVPDFEDLAALRDRFVLKAESLSVKDAHPEELLEKGLSNDLNRAFGQRPWERLCTLDDFLSVKRYLDYIMAGEGEGSAGGEGGRIDRDRKRYFKDDEYELFKRVVRTLEKEDKVSVSDRRFIKLYKLVRTRAFLFHGGAVRREDLCLLRYVGDRTEDFGALREKVDSLLRLE